MTLCNYQPTDRPGIWRCSECRDENSRPLDNPPRRACGTATLNMLARKPIGYGPGTELKELIVKLGVPACSQCTAFADRMDEWGVDGCRIHRGEIVEYLRAKQREMTFSQRLLAAARGAVAGMTFVDPLDAAGSLVDEAIRRASLLLGTGR